jgi:hypothetical protein
MSKLLFNLKYGTLEQAKKAVETTDKERIGYATAGKQLLDRMKAEGDPDYEHTRNKFMSEMVNHRIKSSWVVDSTHAKPEHLKTIARNYPHMIERVAKNPMADADTMRISWEQAKKHPLRVEGSDVRGIIRNPNTPKDVVQEIADKYGGMATREFAQQRLADWKD